MHQRVPAAALLCLTLLSACDKLGELPGKKTTAPAGAAVPKAVQAGKALLDQGQLDAALEKLREMPDDPVSLYYQGLVFIRKGAAVPLPDVGFRDEDKQAAQLLERAVAAKPEFAAAHFALAEMLSAYTLKHYAPQPPGKRRPAVKAPSPSPDDPDATPERIARAYQAAVVNDKTSRVPIDALIKFARAMKRPGDADVAYKELLARDKESADPHVAYGDFLLQEKQDRLGAIEQYQLALVWKPGDAALKDRITDVYLDWAFEHYEKGENANADARLRDAEKSLSGPTSPAAAGIRDLREKLASLRH